MISVRGNHEDHAWLDELERQSQQAIFPIDAYKRVYNLKTGQPWTFQQGASRLRYWALGASQHMRARRSGSRVSIFRTTKQGAFLNLSKRP
ncbi:hypothetical protein [Dictyobacter kobayashii]|uniref:hypothetical protein n=1 Tax=Dictyobacter kobayashii TaxID=2014872 RepID=UPI000F81FE74|nr:hypothetical protein [Dictyobacter kobayashii]